LFFGGADRQIICKVEGRGNGIKTVISNMNDVARALNRPPTYTTKFFGTELGSQSTVCSYLPF
jgi:translation initiation factor 5